MDGELMTCEWCEHRYETHLGRYGCPNCMGEGLDEHYEERAAIQEYEAGLNRHSAEQEAWNAASLAWRKKQKDTDG